MRLNRVELREDAFDDLALPFALRGGMVEEIQVDIPWTKLKTDSVVIRLNQPILLFTPHSEDEWDHAREARRSAARKARELQRLRDAAAPLKANAAYAPVDNESKNGFLESLLAKITDNVQVGSVAHRKECFYQTCPRSSSIERPPTCSSTNPLSLPPLPAQLLITGAVIRFEDYSHADQPFALELAFDSLWIHPEHVTAPDSGGGANHGAGAGSGGESRPPLAHREALVCALCAYMLDATSLPSTPQRSPCDMAALEARMRSSGLPLDAPAAARAGTRRCCLAPLSFAVEVASRRLDEPSLPQHVCCLETGRVAIELDTSELSRLAAIVAYLRAFEALEAYRRFRPPFSQRPSTHAAAWWRFARQAVMWQVHAVREPYTWPAVFRRGKQRRTFMHLQKLALRKGGIERLSEGERVSFGQLCDALSAQDRLLFESLAEAQLRVEEAASSMLKKRQGTSFLSRQHQRKSIVDMQLAAAEREMKLNKDQRKALADLLGGDEERPLGDRLSLHARLLVSELAITVHDDASSTPSPSGLPHMALQANMYNLGIHVGLEPGITLADVFWQTVRVDAVSAGVAGKTAVPLVSPLPAAAQVERRRSTIAAHIPLEVDTTAAFASAGLAKRLPALCARSDSAHQSSTWQLGVRWHNERPELVVQDVVEAQPAVDPSSTVTEEPENRASVRRSELAIRWRSSEQLAILLNHPGFETGGRLLRAVTKHIQLDPIGQLSPQACRPQTPVSKAAPVDVAIDEALAHSVRGLYGMTIRLSVDLATPTWVMIVTPEQHNSKALVLSTRRVLADGLIEPSRRDGSSFSSYSSLRGGGDPSMPRSPSRTPGTPGTPIPPPLSRASSSFGEGSKSSTPLRERAKRASWGMVRHVSILGNRMMTGASAFAAQTQKLQSPQPTTGRFADLEGPSPIAFSSSLKRAAMDAARSDSSRPMESSGAPGTGPPGGRLQIETQHVQLTIVTLEHWVLPSPASSATPLAPFDVTIEARIPLLERGAVAVDVTTTPLTLLADTDELQAFTVFSNAAKRASTASVHVHSSSITPSYAPGPPSAFGLMMMRRSRVCIDVAAVHIALHHSSASSSSLSSVLPDHVAKLPLIEVRLSCLRVAVTGGERLRDERQHLDSDNASRVPTDVADDVPTDGARLQVTLASARVYGLAVSDAYQGSLQLAVLQPAPLSGHGSIVPKADAALLPPGPDGLCVRIDLLPDLASVPFPYRSSPMTIELGELLIDLKPRAIIRLVERLCHAVNSTWPTPPKVNPSDQHPELRVEREVASDTRTAQKEATSRPPRYVVHAATFTVEDDDPPLPLPQARNTAQPSAARLSLSCRQISASTLEGCFDVVVGTLTLQVGLCNASTTHEHPSTTLPPLLCTQRAIRVTAYPGEAWSCKLQLPTIHIREPLLPRASVQSLLNGIHEVKDCLAALLDTRPSSSLPPPELHLHATFQRATRVVDTQLSVQLPGGDKSSGLELQFGASVLHLSIDNCPNISEDASDAPVALPGNGFAVLENALNNLQTPLASPEDDPHVHDEYTEPKAHLTKVLLPPAALHVAYEVRSDGNRPVAWQLALSKHEPAQLELSDSRTLEKLKLFFSHLDRLKARDETNNESGPNAAIDLPSLRVVVATASPSLVLQASNVQLLTDAPTGGRLPDAPYHYDGPMATRLRIREVSVEAFAHGNCQSTLLYCTHTAQPDVHAIDLRFDQPASWLHPPSLDVSIAPMRLVLDAKLTHTISAHIEAWQQGRTGAYNSVGQDTQPFSETSSRSKRDGISQVPLNVNVSLLHSELWLLLNHSESLDSLHSKERFGLCMKFAGLASASHSDSATETGDEAKDTGKRSAFKCHLDFNGGWTSPFTQDCAVSRCMETTSSQPLLAPAIVDAYAEIDKRDVDGVGASKAATAGIDVSGRIKVSVGLVQLKVLADLVAQFGADPSALDDDADDADGMGLSLKERSERARTRAERQASAAAVTAVGTSAALDSSAASAGGSSVLSDWLHTYGLSSLQCNVAASEGFEAVLYTRHGAQTEPALRGSLPSASVSADLRVGDKGAALSQHSIELDTAAEVLVYSRREDEWEPLLARAAMSARAQQVRGGIWSGCIEIGALDFCVTDAMARSCVEMNAAVGRAMRSSLSRDVLLGKSYEPCVQIMNQSGCSLRVVLRHQDGPTCIGPGETRMLVLPDDAAGPNAQGKTMSESRSMSSAVFEEICVEASGIWHVLPPLPLGRFGRWTVLGQPKAAPLPTARDNASALRDYVTEPLAVECVVGPNTATGPGMSIAIRSIAYVHNATATAIGLQLLLPTDVAAEAIASAVAGPPADGQPVLSHATASAMDIGMERLLDLGVVAPGGSLPIPPHLANTAYLRARPASIGASKLPTAFQWPDAASSFWLGRCSQTRQQARELVRLQALFALPATEQLVASWGCSLVGSGLASSNPDGSGGAIPVSGAGGRVRGRLYLTSSAICFHGSRDVRRSIKLECLASLDKSSADRTIGVRSSAAIAARPSSPDGGEQQPLLFCGFRSRNRAYAVMQQHLAPRLPRLARSWRSEASAKLQSHLGLPMDVICLGELSVTSDGAKGVLLLTPRVIGFVPDGSPADDDAAWTVGIEDLVRVWAGEETASSGKKSLLGKELVQPTLRLHTLTFECMLHLQSPLATAVSSRNGHGPAACPAHFRI